MPLLDHFHPPLAAQRHWSAFHGRWAAAVADYLNMDRLPRGCIAEMQVHVGGRVEIDVATFEQLANGAPLAAGGASALATAPAAVWTGPAAILSAPAVFPDELEVLVFDNEGGPSLVGAVELISPANKDRAETRGAFAVKCASYLQQGVGVVVVDVVTSRQANLHDEIMRELRCPEEFLFPGAAPLYAVAYAPTRRDERDLIDMWPMPLAVGQPLPPLPLALRRYGLFTLDLESTYMEARQRSLLA